MANKIQDSSGFLIGGAWSLDDPGFLQKTQFVWAWNILHRGGRPRTRPGNSELIAPPTGLTGEQTDGLNPQGFAYFTPQGGMPHLVMAHAGLIYATPFPFTNWFQVQGLQFYAYADQIIFTTAIKSQTTNPDGSLTFLDKPYDILMIQDGFTQCGYWDGTNAAHTNKIPIGTAAIWNSDRYWVGDGHKLHAGDLNDPLGFNEEKIVATGGFFVLPDEITAIGETPDLQALLVFTQDTTSTFQSAILDRTQWQLTPGFQRLLFKNIGCVGPKAVVNQYGVTWWMSHNGIVSLDTALQTYRTRRIKYSDYGVSRSKTKLHKNLKRVCAGQYENFLFFSWPSADVHNAHTVVMDQLSYETSVAAAQQSPLTTWAGAWKGIRPVQWVTAAIAGQNRCFALSRDYAPQIGSNYRIGIWEAFCNQRADVLLDGTITRIDCGIELRQMAFNEDVKKLTAIEAGLSELRNTVNVKMSFNGRATGFFEVGSKLINASQFSPDPLVTDEFRSQQRVIRSEEIQIASATYVSAQKNAQAAVDQGFGVLLKWTGEAALDSCRIFCDPQPNKYVGAVEVNETTARLVDWDNNETITNDPPPTVYDLPSQSGFADSMTQRYLEPFFSSRG